MERKQQQAELLIAFGHLLRPLQDLVDHPDRQTAQTRAKATGKYTNDMQTFSKQMNEFKVGEPGHDYDIEFHRVVGSLHRLKARLPDIRDDKALLSAALKDYRDCVTQDILAIPGESDGEILEARSPFQAYCKLKVFFETTATEVIWADPYMGPGLFHRYLNDLPDSVAVTLVTKDRGSNSEYQSFLDISRLYAQERGSTKYRLIVESSNHDRLLRCDDQLYHLGGSAKDAGQRSPFTISKLEPTPENFQKLVDLIANGTELFGPSTPIHA